MKDDMLTSFTVHEKEEIYSYIDSLYKNIFPRESIEKHFTNYVGSVSQEWPLAVLKQFVPPGSRILDIGSGFGTFTTMAIREGYLCSGIEPAAFEVKMARLRLQRLFPSSDPVATYQIGFAKNLSTCTDRFEAITLWNVLEHIPDTSYIIKLCYGLLKPNGKLFIVCPNYFTFRNEAHYQIPWTPLDYIFPKYFIQRILKDGRDPSYFQNSIIPVSNWDVLHMLWNVGFTIYTFSGIRVTLCPSSSLNAIQQRLQALSPFVHSVCLFARRG